SDLFCFIARENTSPYSTTTEYWVRPVADENSLMKIAPPPAPPVAHADATPDFISRRIVEQDTPPVLTRNDQFLNILDFRWVWWTWTSSTSATVPRARPYTEPGEVTFDLDSLSTAARSTAQVE